MSVEDREDRRRREAEVVDFLLDIGQEEQKRVTNRTNKNTALTVAREGMFLDELRSALKDVFKYKIDVPKVQKTKAKKKTARILNVVLSDLHYGSDLDPKEVGHRYGRLEEARRTASICRQVADYKRQYREETELYVHLIGDVAENAMHDARTGAPLAEQMARAIRILVQALSYLSTQFPKGVTVFCATGNHGRITSRHKTRAVHQKWDSFETIVYFSLKEALASFKNVKVNIPLSPFYSWKAFDKYGFATHGDTVLKAGSPQQAIQVGSVTNQINSINAAAGRKGEEYSLFVIGHVHTGSMTVLGSGATFMTNGCLLPPDSFGVSIGILEGSCGQWLWESVEGHIVGDSRFMAVNDTDDRDATLDSIVTPFTDF